MIDDGLGFQLVPWRPALEQHLGKQVFGAMPGGKIDWSFTRKRGLGSSIVDAGRPDRTR